MRLTCSWALFLAVALAPAAARADHGAPTTAAVLHVPPAQAEADAAVELVAVIDGAWREEVLVARWRPRGGGAWRDAAFQRSSAGGWYATIPGEAVGRAGVEYYIAGRAPDGAEVAHFASAEAPHPVAVIPGAIDQLAEADRARLGGRTDEVAVDVEGHQFGNRFDHDDGYLRGELRWTHRQLRTLYATTFGFGAITGATPEASLETAAELHHRARYGFGGVQLRLHPAVFVDGRATLGFSHDGFLYGGAVGVTLGRPWGTSVSGGVEGLSDLGGSAWIRLQWDTAPPFLMGASLVRTDLPGAVLADGVLVRYDVSFRIAGGVTTRAALSYGARDGAAHFGGALGAAYSF